MSGHYHQHHLHGYPLHGYTLPPTEEKWTPPNQGYGWYLWEKPAHCAGEYHWIHCDAGQIPYYAVHAGWDNDGGPLFAGRAYHDSELLPAKVVPRRHRAYVPWNGREYPKYQFEVLVSRHTAWEESSRGRVPPNAIVISQTSNGENVYMGRAMHDGTITPGKVQLSQRCIYIPYDGEEIRYNEYEVLILN